MICPEKKRSELPVARVNYAGEVGQDVGDHPQLIASLSSFFSPSSVVAVATFAARVDKSATLLATLSLLGGAFFSTSEPLRDCCRRRISRYGDLYSPSRTPRPVIRHLEGNCFDMAREL